MRISSLVPSSIAFQVLPNFLVAALAVVQRVVAWSEMSNGSIVRLLSVAYNAS